MKTIRDFAEQLKDEAFLKALSEKVDARVKAGEEPKAAMIAVAAEEGYAITEADLVEVAKSASGETLTEEELGKVAGGTTGFAIATMVSAATFTVYIATN